MEKAILFFFLNIKRRVRDRYQVCFVFFSFKSLFLKTFTTHPQNCIISKFQNLTCCCKVITSSSSSLILKIEECCEVSKAWKKIKNRLIYSTKVFIKFLPTFLRKKKIAKCIRIIIQTRL